MAVGGCLKIGYVGAEASCLLVADATAKTLSALIGDLGAEAPDPAFGTAGVIDLTAAAADTLEDLAALIDDYDDYTCSILYGDDIPTEDVLSATVQAGGTDAYILFALVSVLNLYSLTTWERAKEMLPKLRDSDQTVVERLINAATERGEAIAGWLLAARDYVRDLDGAGGSRLVLPDAPLISVTHVYVDQEGVFGADTEITDFVLYAEAGIIARRHSTFPVGMQNVRVECRAGLDPVHEELQHAAIECVAWNLKRFRGEGIGVRGAKVDDFDYSYELTIPMNAQRIFESYRRPA